MAQTSRTILIVDDSPEDLELYRRYLLRDREYSYQIVAATLGRQGLELWQQHQPDAVLLDYRLPDLDGLEFLAKLQQPSPHQSCFPVIMVTGQGNEAIAVQAMKAGAQDYLVKEQITPERLHLAVNGAIETVQLRTQLQQRIERERLVSQITLQIHQSLDIEEILQTTVTEVRQFLRTDRVLIFRLQPDGSGSVTTESVGAGWIPLLSTSYRDPCFSEDYLESFRQGLVTLKSDIHDGSIDPCHVELLAKLQVRANLVVPILQNGQLWGLSIAHHCASPRQWQSLEVDLLAEIAAQVGIALQQAELYQQAQHELAHRRRTEAALRESEERFRQLAENIDAVFWVTELPERRVSYVSPACKRLWGLNPQDICDDRQTWIDLLHPDDRAATKRAFQEKAIEGRFDEEYRILLPDGRVRWVRDRCFPVRDASDRVYRLTGIAEDITNRKQAEAALQESQALFEAFMRYSPATAYIKDEEGRYLYVNPLNEQICDRPIADWLGKTDFELFRSQEAQERQQNDLAALAANGEIEVMETHQQADGERYFLSYKFPIQLSPERRLVAGLSLDITDRKQAEREAQEGKQILDALMEYVPEGITIADAPDVQIRRVSRYGQQLIGRPPEAIEGIPVTKHAQEWDIFYADGITPASNEVLPLTRAVKQGEIVTNEEWVLRRPDGTKITILCNAGPIYVNGAITGGAIVWRDITDRVLFERDRDRILQQEQAARTEAERANRIKDEFLAVLSHELRSPLNPILGWTKLMQTHKLDAAKTAQALATIERNVKLQTQLIDDLLDVAKILRGKLSMNVAPVNLVFVIESAIETVRAAAVAKSILLHPMLPNIGQVSGDAARLQQIVWNLLSNAVKFTPTNGRVEIRLSLASDRSSPVADRSPIANDKQLMTKYAQITVSDTGKGINPDFLPHIFESFRQEDASTSRKYGGLGLGLAIVRSLVEAHGGTIWAHSEGEGRGATFTVELPLLDLEMSQTDESIAQEPDLTGIRVLAVDDEPDTRELFAVLLAQYGAEVLSVTSAAEVLASLEWFQPDVLLSDIGMPDIDGYRLIQQVRALPPEKGGQVVAIALTAYAREEDRQRTLAAGFQHHICKPIDPTKLAMAIWQLVKPAV